AEAFGKLVEYANKHGHNIGKPYFSIDGKKPISSEEWIKMRAIFNCPHGWTNIWDRPSLRGKERIKLPNKNTRAAHLNQKPLDLMKLIIESSSKENSVIWEPFGGLFSASLAAVMLNRIAFSAEINHDYFTLGMQRFNELSD
ncbi:site-specific DNA-methyltransferase, partial [Bacillus stratosphericus]